MRRLWTHGPNEPAEEMPRLHERLLEHRVALVTGAGRGNGAAIARGLAEHGADVALADIDGAAAREQSRAIESSTGRATLALEADIALAAAAVSVVEATVKRFSRLDILVNNAGILTVEPIHELTAETWERTLAVNLSGALFCIKAAAARMDGGASIVNITSVGAEIAAPGLAAYCASKGGLQMLTRAAAIDLAPRGIRANAIAPGLIMTDMARRLWDSPQALAATVERVPLGRAGQPRDLVGAILYLASDLSAYVTGATILVDGGFLLS
jgi:NAD(P)-dependent dehydrogenase (short-subunit alcohol dehydrogenase family)